MEEKVKLIKYISINYDFAEQNEDNIFCLHSISNTRPTYIPFCIKNPWQILFEVSYESEEITTHLRNWMKLARLLIFFYKILTKHSPNNHH